jgi:protein tyrosine/serine phosphatase
LRWAFGVSLSVLLTVVPYLYYRCSYTWTKRLRDVTAGRVYRSGAMTASGFVTAIERYGIRTIINLQNEAQDPDLPLGYFSRHTIRESDLCEKLGVRYRVVCLDLLPRNRKPTERPAAIEQFLELMDDPSNYPVLIHCKAGLHRTGIFAALYRMEYEGWTRAEAIRELKSHGFGEFACSSANEYITQYLLSFQPGQRRNADIARHP